MFCIFQFDVCFCTISVGSITFPINNRFDSWLCFFLFFLKLLMQECCCSILTLSFLLHSSFLLFCCCFRTPKSNVCTLVGNFLFFCACICLFALYTLPIYVCACVSVCVRVFTFQFSVYFDCVKECIQFGVSEQTRKCCACICHKNLTCSHEMLFSCERSMSFTRRRTPNCQNEVFHSCHVYRHRHRHRAIGPVLASTVFFLC